MVKFGFTVEIDLRLKNIGRKTYLFQLNIMLNNILFI